MMTAMRPLLPIRRTILAGAGLTLAVGGIGVGVGSAAAGTKASNGAGAAAGAWTTYGGNPARTSNAGGPPLRPLRRRWIATGLDGAVYGEPLVAGGRVFVATEADEVVALDASTGQVAWRRIVGTPVPSGALPCGDIAPTVGVTSTMVLDQARRSLYVSAAILVAGQVRHVLVALDTSSGQVEWQRDLDRPRWDAAAQLQRAALALSDGRVVVGFGGNYGDCGPYHGYLVAVPETGRGRILAYEVPTQREGAVWAPSGVSVAPNGDIFAATGNGSSTTAYDSGDSVIELSPTLHRLASFAPADWAADNADDGDLGSAAPMLLPGGRILIVGKESTGYLLDAGRLGGIGHPLAAIRACFSIGGDAYEAPLAYVACPQGSLVALRVGARQLSVAWRAPSGVTGSPTLAGGLLWSLAEGHLVGLSPRTGQVAVSVAAIPTAHFAAPSAAAGLLVVGGTGTVEAFEGPTGYRP